MDEEGATGDDAQQASHELDVTVEVDAGVENPGAATATTSNKGGRPTRDASAAEWHAQRGAVHRGTPREGRWSRLLAMIVIGGCGLLMTLCGLALVCLGPGVSIAWLIIASNYSDVPCSVPLATFARAFGGVFFVASICPVFNGLALLCGKPVASVAIICVQLMATFSAVGILIWGTVLSFDQSRLQTFQHGGPDADAMCSHDLYSHVWVFTIVSWFMIGVPAQASKFCINAVQMLTDAA
jgi:hypothetical protein